MRCDSARSLVQVADYVARKDRYLDAMSAGQASCWDMEGGFNHAQPGSGLVQYGKSGRYISSPFLR